MVAMFSALFSLSYENTPLTMVAAAFLSAAAMDASHRYNEGVSEPYGRKGRETVEGRKQQRTFLPRSSNACESFLILERAFDTAAFNSPP